MMGQLLRSFDPMGSGVQESYEVQRSGVCKRERD